jgi:hypothetical protein
MNEIPELASAILALAFAAVMLVAGQQFIEYRSTNNAFKPPVVKIGGATSKTLDLHAPHMKLS